MKKEKNPYYDENDMLKVRPFSYGLNGKGSKEEDDQIILNAVNHTIEHKLQETDDKTGYTKETVYRVILDIIRDYYFMCRHDVATEQAAIWAGQHDDFKDIYDENYLNGDNFY